MFNFIEGEILLIDKELNWSSFDVVNYLKPAIHDFTKKHFNQKTKIKIGHAGTLDPLATGLLIICTGKKTKIIQEIQNLRKTYTGAFFIGATTPSFDKELPIDNTFPTKHINEQLILKTAKSFIGEQLQIPPEYSAVNIAGKRAYELARLNQPVEIAPKPITIYRFDITKIEGQLVYFEIECSKGTYIRSIARDFGKALNSGAYLDNLRRTKIGDYTIENAIKIKQFVHLLKNI
ncbi:MAG: tRNA pseudouridine synthase B [Bacteroidia bacterium]|nr:MAG: tRNA pseudouridine synthase B [Bacteroidia bacterium]